MGCAVFCALRVSEAGVYLNRIKEGLKHGDFSKKHLEKNRRF